MKYGRKDAISREFEELAAVLGCKVIKDLDHRGTPDMVLSTDRGLTLIGSFDVTFAKRVIENYIGDALVFEGANILVELKSGDEAELTSAQKMWWARPWPGPRFIIRHVEWLSELVQGIRRRYFRQ